MQKHLIYPIQTLFLHDFIIASPLDVVKVVTHITISKKKQNARFDKKII